MRPCSASTSPSEYCSSPWAGTRFTPSASTFSASGRRARARVELRQVGARRREVGVDAQRSEVVLLGQVRAGPCSGRSRPGSAARRACRARHSAPRCIRPARRRRPGASRASKLAGSSGRQRARRRDAHRAHRVAQQRRQRLQALRGREALQAVGGRGAHLGVGVAGGCDALGLVAAPDRRAAPPARWRARRPGWPGRPRAAPAPRRRPARRPAPRRSAWPKCGTWRRCDAVPALDRRRRPGRRPVLVAGRAGVGRAGDGVQVGPRARACCGRAARARSCSS